MLSSWLRRIAAGFAIGVQHLTWHLGLSASKPTDTDHVSTRDDVERTTAALSVTAAELRGRVHRPLKTPSVRLRQRYLPVQVYTQ